MTSVSALPIVADSIESWNANAEERLLELRSDEDASYRDLISLVTNYLDSRGIVAGATVLDVGSGLGFVSRSLADRGLNVTAIDPAAEAVRLAQEEHRGSLNPIRFLATNLEDFAKREDSRQYDALVMNMTLHSVARLSAFLSAAERVMAPNSFIFATIPNPGTYLQGRADIDTRELDLSAPQTLDMPFRIHGHRAHQALVRFYHYPLRDYSLAARAAGLFISDFDIPDRIGNGRFRDVAVLVFERWHDAA